MVDTKTLQQYRKNRSEHPWMPAASALRWAKAESNRPDDGWEEAWNSTQAWTREVDGFEIRITVETESQCPEDGDMGHYVDGVRNGYNYDWGGNYPEPNEELPLNLPYTSFASGAYSQNQHAWPYWIPDGVEEQFDYFHRCGASKQVAWMLTKEWVEKQIRDFFGGPLYYVNVVVTASLEGVELGSDSIGTNYIGFDDAHIFECVRDLDMIGNAIEAAKAASRQDG